MTNKKCKCDYCGKAIKLSERINIVQLDKNPDTVIEHYHLKCVQAALNGKNE